jgi:uncharacterized protein YjbI with pentapeptide repeats
MRVGALITCGLLTIFGIFLLSTVTAASEYREINNEVTAEEVLQHIENGEDINITNCIIVGKLDVSKINLITVHNPNFNPKQDLNESENEQLLDLIWSSQPENYVVIEKNITIKNSIIEDKLNFSNVLFVNSVNFQGTKFNYFPEFRNIVFHGPADFKDATFNSYADFYGTRFTNETDFGLTTFNNSTDFVGCVFYGPVRFYGADFNDDADFMVTLFLNSSTFEYTNFKGSVNFVWTIFDAPADFRYTKFNQFADFSGPETTENITTSAETCEFFTKYYKSEARYEDADNIYYNYRKERQNEKDLTNPTKWTDILDQLICGYGLRPFNTLYFGGFLILLFSIIYFKGQGICRLSDIREQRSRVLFWDALYFSISTFTTVGSVDWYPENKFRKWVTFEGILGWIMLGIFMATLTNVMIRS